MRANSRTFFFALFALSCGYPSLGADKSGVSPNTISLPKGPGSIEGLGESFQPALNTGTAKYSVGLKLPPGTAGHAPELRLLYEGGSGNGPLGFGWQLPLTYVQRRSDHGIPTYGEDVGFNREDTFITDSNEELVPQANGAYFCKNEGAFIRYRRAGDAWEATTPDGTTLRLGGTGDSRIQDGTNRVFSWLLEREMDTRGNTIIYSYTNYPGLQNTNQKYLATISYGPGAPPRDNFHFVTFLYEDRPDWFEDCRSGFIVRTGKRLKSIVMGTQGPMLAGHSHGDFNGDGTPDNLIRRYDLTYLNYSGTNSYWSLLAGVTLVGADDTNSLPATTFGYAVRNPPDQVSAVNHIIGSVNEPPFVMDNPTAELLDLNGDGLPDILKTDLGAPGSHQGYLNLGESITNGVRVVSWQDQADVDAQGGTAWSYDLGSPSTHLADMDGDGAADLVYNDVKGVSPYF